MKMYGLTVETYTAALSNVYTGHSSTTQIVSIFDVIVGFLSISSALAAQLIS